MKVSVSTTIRHRDKVLLVVIFTVVLYQFFGQLYAPRETGTLAGEYGFAASNLLNNLRWSSLSHYS